MNLHCKRPDEIELTDISVHRYLGGVTYVSIILKHDVS